MWWILNELFIASNKYWQEVYTSSALQLIHPFNTYSPKACCVYASHSPGASKLKADGSGGSGTEAPEIHCLSQLSSQVDRNII